jgi:hypothetical protein
MPPTSLRWYLSTPRGHRSAQAVGFRGREAGGDHRDLHYLLLENGDAQRALQGLLEARFAFFLPR